MRSAIAVRQVRNEDFKIFIAIIGNRYSRFSIFNAYLTNSDCGVLSLRNPQWVIAWMM